MTEIAFAVWNMEWLNRLFLSSKDTPQAAFKPDDAWFNQDKRITVGDRKQMIAAGLADLDCDLLVVNEGPNSGDEFQLIFDELAPGTWTTFLQRSLSPNAPDRTDVFSSQQCNGIAVRTDRGLFADDPLTVFDAMEEASGAIFTASEPFFMDTGRDKVTEWFRFERRPVYAEVQTADGAKLRVLGVHLKSKGIFSAYEWSRWWTIADANRERLLAQCRRLREAFLDPYLSEPETKDIPLIVCGDINDGPGFDTSEMRLLSSGVETLMGSVWKPKLALGNALFDGLKDRERARLDFSSLSTTRFADPIFNDTHHRVWIDHVLYSHNTGAPFVRNADIRRRIEDEDLPYWKISDHFPVTATLQLDPIETA